MSPDGTQIAFTARYGAPHVYGSILYVARLGGLDADVRRLSPDPCPGGCSTDGPDRIVGTKHGDLIVAGAGGDVIHAGDGQNVVYPGHGHDSVDAGTPSFPNTFVRECVRTGDGPLMRRS